MTHGELLPAVANFRNSGGSLSGMKMTTRTIANPYEKSFYGSESYAETNSFVPIRVSDFPDVCKSSCCAALEDSCQQADVYPQHGFCKRSRQNITNVLDDGWRWDRCLP